MVTSDLKGDLEVELLVRYTRLRPCHLLEVGAVASEPRPARLFHKAGPSASMRASNAHRVRAPFLHAMQTALLSRAATPAHRDEENDRL